MGITIGEFEEYCAEAPVIAALKSVELLERLRPLECKIIYVLCGNICNIAQIVDSIKEMGKIAIVHIDLVNGFSSKEICVDFMAQHTKADGIISTKPYLVKRAKELGLFSVQRFWVMDALTYYNVVKYVKTADPDLVEFMPAGLDKAIRYLKAEIHKPMMASGLVLDKEVAIGALSAGAIAVSTANEDLWV